jgi:Double zinc ribbon
MPPLAVFGIESSGLSLVVDLLLLFVVVLYLSLVYWTYIDARRRIEDPMLVGCATAASIFFPFVGTIIYMILRPPEYIEDVRERDLEVQATEARLHEIEGSLCPHCDYRIEPDFVRCPSCLRKLKERCVNCSRPLDRAWTICPYCEADVPGISPPRQRRRRAAAVREDEESELAAAAPAPKSAAARKRAAAEPALAETAAEPDAAIAPEPVNEVELDTQPAAAVSEPSPRRRSSGRSPRPGGRARPTS